MQWFVADLCSFVGRGVRLYKIAQVAHVAHVVCVVALEFCLLKKRSQGGDGFVFQRVRGVAGWHVGLLGEWIA
jgi:hypothetical protein